MEVYLTRDGIAESVSRDQILRRVNGYREIFIFPVQLTTSRNDNLTRLILTLAICDDHTNWPYREIDLGCERKHFKSSTAPSVYTFEAHRG